MIFECYVFCPQPNRTNETSWDSTDCHLHVHLTGHFCKKLIPITIDFSTFLNIYINLFILPADVTLFLKLGLMFLILFFNSKPHSPSGFCFVLFCSSLLFSVCCLVTIWQLTCCQLPAVAGKKVGKLSERNSYCSLSKYSGMGRWLFGAL